MIFIVEIKGRENEGRRVLVDLVILVCWYFFFFYRLLFCVDEVIGKVKIIFLIMEYKEENNKLVKFYVKEEILMYVESFGNLIKGVW